MTKFLCEECIHNSDKGGGCLIPKNLGYVDNCNRYLPKDRPIVQTNEKWLKSMTTEELAEWIYRAMFYKSCQKDVEYGAYMQMMTKKDYIENWLREKHHGNNDM